MSPANWMRLHTAPLGEYGPAPPWPVPWLGQPQGLPQQARAYKHQVGRVRPSMPQPSISAACRHPRNAFCPNNFPQPSGHPPHTAASGEQGLDAASAIWDNTSPCESWWQVRRLWTRTRPWTSAVTGMWQLPGSKAVASVTWRRSRAPRRAYGSISRRTGRMGWSSTSPTSSSFPPRSWDCCWRPAPACSRVRAASPAGCAPL